MTEHHRIAEYLAGRSLSARDRYRVPCPAHGGKDNNLSVAQGNNGGTLFTCHSHGCTFEQIAASLPAWLWSDGAFIPQERTVQKREPKPLTLRRKDDSRTFEFAERMWINSEFVDRTDHAYAVKKKFQPSAFCKVGHLPRHYGPLSKGDRVLVIRMQDESGCFTGAQFINEQGDRAFAGSQGMLILSNAHWDSSSVFHVVEGYATGTAVNDVFPGEHNVPVVAFSLGNLSKVETLLRARIEQERDFTPKIIVHDEPEGIDCWDIAHDADKRARYFEITDGVAA